jgi:site-specific DNA-methyltransferase (adenine-specific)
MKLIKGDCLTVIPDLGRFDCVFADPPDNLNLAYGEYGDNLPDTAYLAQLEAWFLESTRHAPIVWFSFNARWTAQFGAIVSKFLTEDWTYRPCVQVFTFGQHNHHWLGNNHRPLWCIYQNDATFHPDAIRVPSWRQLNGDKRADPRGRVPGDVFDFARVTGNSRQRRRWHPTQLHEELVERVVRFSTPDGGTVLDPFAGTGTTLRVCNRIGRRCVGIEIDSNYCEKIAAELNLGVKAA